MMKKVSPAATQAKQTQRVLGSRKRASAAMGVAGLCMVPLQRRKLKYLWQQGKEWDIVGLLNIVYKSYFNVKISTEGQRRKHVLMMC